MSKYVDKKHGLIIGSDNIFFIVDDVDAPEGVEKFRSDYRAIVWAKGYDFDQISTLNVFLETPVNQLLWSMVKIPIQEEYEREPVDRTRYVLKNWVRNWLEKNVGAIHDKWDIRTYNQKTDRQIFFKRRKDALAFVRMIENILSGIKIRD